MYSESFSLEEKQQIAKNIKPISFEDMEADFNELKKIGPWAHTISERSRIGNNVVDYFTYFQRLHTRGKYNINYFEFIANLDEFTKKKFIKNMLEYYKTVKNKNNTKNVHIVLKETYNICISAINIFRPVVAMEIYTKYQPTGILDFCAGWGGRAIGACVLNIPKYIGIEINTHLADPYEKMYDYLKTQSKTEMQMIFTDASKFDFSVLQYDMVFTSPPYYFLEKYENNNSYSSKKVMNEKFYKPLFSESFKHLKSGGYYILNVNKEIYDNVCVELFGNAHEIFACKKSKRQNEYKEVAYVWRKHEL